MDVERILFRNGAVEVGAFRCPLGHAEFRTAGGPIRDHHVFVFPRSRVWIRQSGGRSFATDATVVPLYNPGQEFERRPLDGAGDVCDWFAVDGASAFEAARRLDPAVEDRPERAFRLGHGRSDALTYRAQRELFVALTRGVPLDPLAVEERVLWLLDRVLDASHARRPSRETDRAAHEIAEAARVVLGARFRDAMSLAEVSSAVGVSRYRLCRLFRAATGTTLHAQREQLRLRAALEALETDPADLTSLALALGYSSHSHFTSCFTRAFGAPPSRVRGRLARGVSAYSTAPRSRSKASVSRSGGPPKRSA